MSQIFTTAGGRVGRRPRRGLVLVLAVVTAGLLATAAYGGYVLTHSATPVETFGCYQTVSLDANTAVFAAGNRSPLATCADSWSSAFPGVAQPASFAACVLDSGAIGVFPADTGDPCAKLGLAAAGKTAAAHR